MQFVYFRSFLLSLPQIVLAIHLALLRFLQKSSQFTVVLLLCRTNEKNNSQSYATPNCSMKRNLCCFQIPFVACVWHSVYIAFQPDLPKSRHCNPILKYHRYTNIHTSFIVISALPQIKKNTRWFVFSVFSHSCSLPLESLSFSVVAINYSLTESYSFFAVSSFWWCAFSALFWALCSFVSRVDFPDYRILFHFHGFDRDWNAERNYPCFGMPFAIQW